MSWTTNTEGNMLYPPEYQEFAMLVKKQVVYSLVLRVLPGEITTIGRAKARLGKAYISTLFEVQKSLSNELGSIRQRLREIGGEIISEKQEEFVRVVISSLQGNTYTHRYANYMLLSESEETVKSFIQGTQPALA
ncbi:hypothetical protein PP175_05780 [Aneurinibacillus sp. Ricciae_BoGa-3]|uniref:hypothetical protein n=1 Tax=Aneurinibacillus sp. Ricciae_BoGa-3 TaxID=3022697 RepID=UPI00233FDB7C|nr:hypothetical protein [Aneurinibacillus sp. Ricciae_BoGa-3]WCK55458.1 hypothetical protein PP175_05780 [Aneurinibacillus sp. Ricciae_BoGa-3]